MKKILVLLIALMAVICFASCDEESGEVKVDGNSVDNVGSINEKTSETNKNVFIPDDSYVLYKETYTKTNVVTIHEYDEKGNPTKITKTKANGEIEETIFENEPKRIPSS